MLQIKEGHLATVLTSLEDDNLVQWILYMAVYVGYGRTRFNSKKDF